MLGHVARSEVLNQVWSLQRSHPPKGYEYLQVPIRTLHVQGSLRRREALYSILKVMLATMIYCVKSLLPATVRSLRVKLNFRRQAIPSVGSGMLTPSQLTPFPQLV
jgi:hypothetical protein